jgi:hypothetical protein
VSVGKASLEEERRRLIVPNIEKAKGKLRNYIIRTERNKIKQNTIEQSRVDESTEKKRRK